MIIIHHFRRIYGKYLKLIKEIQTITTCNHLDLETLGWWLLVPKNLPGHWGRVGSCELSPRRWQYDCSKHFKGRYGTNWHIYKHFCLSKSYCLVLYEGRPISYFQVLECSFHLRFKWSQHNVKMTSGRSWGEHQVWRERERERESPLHY